MKISWLLLTIGAIVIALGLIFHLQGQAVVGPETSFMYSNADWVAYGLEIAIFGSAIIVCGSIIKKVYKR